MGSGNKAMDIFGSHYSIYHTFQGFPYLRPSGSFNTIMIKTIGVWRGGGVTVVSTG